MLNDVITSLIGKLLRKKETKQGIIGVRLPSMVSGDDYNKVVVDLLHLNGELHYDLQLVLLPPPDPSFKNKDPKVLADRVFRDRNDGIRYNRLYIALYWDECESVVKSQHDIFIDASGEDNGRPFAVYLDSRPFDSE